MQWSAERYAGFSKVKPWFMVNPNYHAINVAQQEQDPESILSFYRLCLALRKKSRTLLYGRYKEHYPQDRHLYIYTRTLDHTVYLIIRSLYRFPCIARVTAEYVGRRAKRVLGNLEPISVYDHLDPAKYPVEMLPGRFVMKPYEARVYRLCP